MAIGTQSNCCPGNARYLQGGSVAVDTGFMSDAIDISALSAAYASFFEEAEQGGFGEPPVGEWTAEQVVAHVALNDRAMMAVSESIVNGEPTGFRNEAVQEPGALAELISEFDGMAGLIEQGRAIAAQAVAVAEGLSADQLKTVIDCRFVSDGELAFEQPMPWEMVAVLIQATKHLPGHTDQLRNLRD